MLCKRPNRSGRSPTSSLSARPGFSWLTDQQSAAAAGSSATFTWGSFTTKSYTDLVSDLTPLYASSIPNRDGWGRDLEFGIASDLEAPIPIAIRARGADGTFDSSGYQIGAFVATDYGQDIVGLEASSSSGPGTEIERLAAGIQSCTFRGLQFLLQSSGFLVESSCTYQKRLAPLPVGPPLKDELPAAISRRVFERARE